MQRLRLAKIRRSSLLLLAAILCGGMTHAVELRTAAQPNTPKFYRINGQQTGISYDIIQAIQRVDPTLRFTGYEQEIPTKRIEAMLEQGQLDVYVGFLITPARQRRFDFIDVPLFSPQARLISRKDDPLTIQSLAELLPLGKDGIVLTTRGTPLVEELQQLQPGLLIDAGTDDNELNLQKLRRKRARAFYQFDFMLAHALRQTGLADQVRWQPYRGNSEIQYMAISRNVPAETRQRLQQALEKLHAKGELQRIYQKYLQSPASE